MAGVLRGFGVKFFSRESLREATKGNKIEGSDSLVPIPEP